MTTRPLNPDRPVTMHAAVFVVAGELAVEARPVPEPGDHEALIEVDHCGICGTDLHFVLEGWARPGMVPGHEYSGRIVATGAAVHGWEVGDLVVGRPAHACGSCAHCLDHRPQLCDQRDAPVRPERSGAFAPFVLVHESQLVRIPAGLAPRVAALAEPLAVALHAIDGSRITDYASVLVSGAGPIGALIVAALVARGSHEITVVEPGVIRAGLATALGARRVLHPDDLEVPSIAEPGRIVDGAVEVVFECSGRRSAMEAGLAQLRRGGTLVLVGSGIDPPRFDPNRILLNELVVTGSFNHGETGFDDALSLLASGRLPTDLLIDPHDVSLDGIVAGMRQLVAGEIAGKVMVDPRGNSAVVSSPDPTTEPMTEPTTGGSRP